MGEREGVSDPCYIPPFTRCYLAYDDSHTYINVSQYFGRKRHNKNYTQFSPSPKSSIRISVRDGSTSMTRSVGSSSRLAKNSSIFSKMSSSMIEIDTVCLVVSGPKVKTSVNPV